MMHKFLPPGISYETNRAQRSRISFQLKERSDEVPEAKLLEECFAKWDHLSARGAQRSDTPFQLSTLSFHL
jgi:hypothetical protein